MDDFINDILGEELEGSAVPLAAPSEPPSASPSSQGGGFLVKQPSPAATLARRTIGKGRLNKDGLKRLSQRHKLMIGMHLNGVSNAKIAEEMGITTGTVGGLVRDPLAQEVIAYYYEGVEAELKALFPKVVDTIRDSLDNGSISTRLKGVDRFTKLTGMGEKGDDKRGVTINIVQDARKKFVQEIRDAARTQEVIDVEVEDE